MPDTSLCPVSNTMKRRSRRRSLRLQQQQQLCCMFTGVLNREGASETTAPKCTKVVSELRYVYVARVRACVHACVCVCVCLFGCAEHVGGEAALPNLCRPAKLVHGCQKQGSRPC